MVTATPATVSAAPDGSSFWSTVKRSDARFYLACTGLIAVVVTLILHLWRATWSIPFFYAGDAVSSAAIFKTVLTTGWYETQPDLGVPYGQHYHDFPFSDELNPALARVIGLFTHQVGVVVNVYYVLGFWLIALGALYFFRRCGLSPWVSLALSVLYAITPYHFFRNENHLFLSAYFGVPVAMTVVLAAIRGEPLWGRRAGSRRWWSAVTGRGAATVAIVALVTLDGAYYGVFIAVLLAAAGLFAFYRTRNWRRFVGVVATGGVLLLVFVAAMLPDILYTRLHGADPGAFVRHAFGTEQFSFKFAELVLPATNHPIGFLDQLRLHYNANYPYSGELPALGFVGVIGFLVLLGRPLARLAGRWRATDSTRSQTLDQLSALTWVAFLTCTFGGLASLIALFLTDSIRSWNRMSILLVLMALAATGLLVEAAVPWCRRRLRRRGEVPASGILAGLALVVLVVGCADQWVRNAEPAYTQIAGEWTSDEKFVDDLQDRLPAGSMLFQLPYQAFPESGKMNNISESDQLIPFLHSSTLGWSGGGLKGRPQTDWPGPVSREPTEEMTRNLVMIGFRGIVVDRNTLVDHGQALLGQLQPVLGAPALGSQNGRYWFFSLQPISTEVERTTTPAERAARAAEIVNSGGTG